MFKLSIETLGTESENVKRCGSAFATALNVRDLQQRYEGTLLKLFTIKARTGIQGGVSILVTYRL